MKIRTFLITIYGKSRESANFFYCGIGAFNLVTRTLGFVNAPALMQRIVTELTGARGVNSF